MSILAAFILALTVNSAVSELKKNEQLPAPKNITVSFEEGETE